MGNPRLLVVAPYAVLLQILLGDPYYIWMPLQLTLNPNPKPLNWLMGTSRYNESAIYVPPPLNYTTPTTHTHRRLHPPTFMGIVVFNEHAHTEEPRAIPHRNNLKHVAHLQMYSTYSKIDCE